MRWVYVTLLGTSVLLGCNGRVEVGPGDPAVHGDSRKLVLIAKGSFHDSGFVPAQVRFGFVSARGDALDASAKTIDLTFGSLTVSGVGNDEVSIDVPSDAKPLIAYQLVLKRIHRNAGFELPRSYLTEPRYLDPKSDTGGVWVDVPVFESIFSPDDPLPACFDVEIRNRFVGDQVLSEERLARFGRVLSVSYGFTTATPQDYCGHPVTEGMTSCDRKEVPLVDAAGRPGFEDTLAQVSGLQEKTDATGEILMKPDGSFRVLPRESATNLSAPIFVRVPAGKNLAYRLKLERFGDACPGADQGAADTELFYRSADNQLLTNN
jgi:hypothetical protein